MNLYFNTDLAKGYKSPAQIAKGGEPDTAGGREGGGPVDQGDHRL